MKRNGKYLIDMKRRYLFNWAAIALIVVQMLSFTSCSDDDDNSDWPTDTDKTEIFIERFTTLVTNLTTLRDGATYGELKDNYPVSSKAMLDTEIAYLQETIARLREGSKKLADSEADRIIREAYQIEQSFKATKRAQDFAPVPAELLVNGKNGGYIDFGVHPEYSAFGESGKQAFTVEFWAKLTDIDEYLNSFVFLLSTFTDDDTKDHERKGWAVNSHFGRLRMTYGIGYSDLFEPGFGFSTLDQWVHVAVVTDENGVDGESNNNIPVMTKIYVNGQLMLSERGRDDRLPYTSNDRNVAMVAFTGLSATGSRVGEKSTNGCMRHLHIWKSAKTQTEIRQLMDTPDIVTGTETDLVCGWAFDRTVSDNNDIKDLTGRFSARLVGDFQWVENR